MIPMVSRIIEVCVFRFRADHIEYLVLRRAPQEQVHPGMWQIVTGRVEEGEKALNTALRELQEETGLVPEHCWSLPMLTFFFDVRSNAINMCPVFAVQVKDGTNPVLSGEHITYAWLPHESARTRLVWPSHRKAVDLVDRYIVKGEEAAYRLELDVS